jgi:hypothetical protein
MYFDFKLFHTAHIRVVLKQKFLNEGHRKATFYHDMIV